MMMPTDEELSIKALRFRENRLYSQLTEGAKQAAEPQLREELYKLSAQVSSHRQLLLSREGQPDEQ